MRHSLPLVRALFLSYIALTPAFAQSPTTAVANSAPKTGEKPFAAEPFVIEQLETKIRFEPDGKGQRDTTLRVRVQSESALREFGLLAYSYMASFESLDVLYARVRKPDGTLIETPASDVQDLDSAVSREAPMYTDQREKHFAIKSLGVGDLLEVSLRWTVHDPVAPGHFWYDYNFFQAGICLKEELEIDVPSNLPVKLAGSNPAPEIREQGGWRIYTFHTSHLNKQEEEEIPAWEKNFYGTAPPSVRLSSFSSWADAGVWFGGLQQPRVRVTPEIRTKADELTKGKSTGVDKIRAIYDFVASHFRYIGVDLGQGRYTPHAAEEVLANRYGDCKDKHTLFAALLQAEGITAYPALISTAFKIDPAMPSVSLFDHVITAVPQGDSFLFLDTTPEVAPFGLLLRQLRDRQALVIPPNAPARLVRTPTDPPFLNREKYQMDASLDLNGVLNGKARLEDRGDSEVLVRAAYRNTPQNRWKDLAQTMVGRMGFAGTVSDVTAAQPESTSDPFWFAYAYHRTDYSDWKAHRITLPFPPLFLPELSEKQKSSKEPLPLGSPQEVVYETSLKLPDGITPILPGNAEHKNDFAEYSANYSFDKGILHGTRRLATKLREVPGSERAAYNAFVKQVEEDQNHYILLAGDFEANSPLRQGQSLLKEGKAADAVALLEKAVAADGENKRLKFTLGRAYLRVPNDNKAMDVFQELLGEKTNPSILNSVAYELASANRRISDALEYASRAVAETSADTMKVTLDSATPEDYMRIQALAAQWDTLGWAKFRAGDIASAEKYTKASWLLWQRAVIGEHLVEVYEKLGKKQEAARICRLALQAPGKDDEVDTRDKLRAAQDRLGVSNGDAFTVNAKSYIPPPSGGIDLSEMRSLKIPFQANLHGEFKSATFALAVENGNAGVQAQFVSGADELRPASKALATAKFHQSFPDETPVRILRQGMFSCSKYTKDCTFVFFPLESPLPLPVPPAFPQ